MSLYYPEGNEFLQGMTMEVSNIILHHPMIFFRQQYFEVIDLLVSELTKQPAFKYVEEMETVMLQSFAEAPVELTTTFNKMYCGDFNMNDLRKQLQLLPDLLKTANIRHNMGIKKVTSISTIM